MDHRCIQCHFLAKKVQKQGISSVEPVGRPEREKMRKNNCQLQSVDGFQCYMNVWDEALDMGVKNREHNIVERDRKGKCFFYQIKPNMTFETAKHLQQSQPNPPPEGFTLLGERAWLLWVVSTVVLVAVCLFALKG